MILIGFGIGIWGIRTLTAQQSLGVKGKLVTDGPYQYTRNPQYLGFILLYAGTILVTYSFMALVTGTLTMILFSILPLSEEPWLRQQYGKSYEEYCKKVPRFIGIRSFKPRNAINRWDRSNSAKVVCASLPLLQTYRTFFQKRFKPLLTISQSP